MGSAGHGNARLVDVLGARPELLRDYTRFYALFWEHELVPLPLLELVRLNVAHLLDCRSERALRYCKDDAPLVDEASVQRLEASSSSGFDAGVRACLAYSEKFVFDVHGISDEDVAAVKAHLGVESTVALTEALALFDGFMRFQNQLVGNVEGSDAEVAAQADATLHERRVVHVPLPTASGARA